jgi:dolichol-phosphate mannosyltransferase
MAPSKTRPAATPPTGDGRTETMRLSIVLIVFNERESVAELVEGLFERVDDRILEIILLLAPASPPITHEICERLAREHERVRVSLQKENPGAGLAVRQGIAEARGSHILLMDSDGEMDVETVPLMVAAAETPGVDMVVGSRWMRGGGVEGYHRLRGLLNRCYQAIFRVLFRTPVHDLTLGFKLCRADVFQAMPWDSQFHDIGCETTLRPIRAGYRVTEVPTVWRRRKEGSSNNPTFNNLKYVWKALAILIGPPHNRKTT